MRQLLTEMLRERFTIAIAADGQAVLHQLAAEQPALVLLELELPDVDGLVLLAKIRARHNPVPIIMLSGRQEQVYRVMPLRAGADDVVSKPLDLEELSARIDAVLRRATPPSPPPVARCGALTMTAAGGARVNGVPFRLTLLQYELLTVLIAHQDRLLTRAELLHAVWGPGLTDCHLIDEHFDRIRAKLARVPGAPRLINERRRGYRLGCDEVKNVPPELTGQQALPRDGST